MKRDDFSKFFKERYDFCSTLEKWEKPDGRSGCSYAATYFFLMDPLEKVNRMETDIVYIGKAKRIGGPRSISSPHDCRLHDYYYLKRDHEESKVEFMRSLAEDGRHYIPYRAVEPEYIDGVHKITISWLPCLNEPIANHLEGVLLNAFFNAHKVNPLLNRTDKHQRNPAISVAVALKTMLEMETQGQIGKGI